MDNFAKRFLNSPDTEEAREWLLGASKNNFRNLGELASTAESLELVTEIYAAGAASVLAVEIDRDENYQNTGKLLIELSDDPTDREKVLAIAGRLAEAQGFNAEPDVGQRYVLVSLD